MKKFFASLEITTTNVTRFQSFRKTEYKIGRRFMQNFFFDREINEIVLEPGKTGRKIKAYGDKLMLVEASFADNGEGSVHVHPHDQITYCLEGTFEFCVDGEKKTLIPGDSVFVPGGISHGLRLKGEKGRVLDIFTPKRQDFLDK
jgi:quercetin dioxygenase-like cupin family protein